MFQVGQTEDQWAQCSSGGTYQCTNGAYIRTVNVTNGRQKHCEC